MLPFNLSAKVSGRLRENASTSPIKIMARRQIEEKVISLCVGVQANLSVVVINIQQYLNDTKLQKSPVEPREQHLQRFLRLIMRHVKANQSTLSRIGRENDLSYAPPLVS